MVCLIYFIYLLSFFILNIYFIFLFSYLFSGWYFVSKHVVHHKRNISEDDPTKSSTESRDHDLAIGTKVDVWFENKKKYFSGKIFAFEEKRDTYTVMFHSKKNSDITLCEDHCTDGQQQESEDGDRWNLTIVAIT